MFLKVLELLIMLWKAIGKAWTAVCGKESDPPAPREPQPKPITSDTPPAAATPYRQEVDPKPEPPKIPKIRKEAKLVCTLTNESECSESELKKIKEKTRRRALRHFDGKEVRHRVTEKKADFIEFAFFRTKRGQGRKGAALKIRWQKPGTQAVSPTGSEKSAQDTGS